MIGGCSGLEYVKAPSSVVPGEANLGLGCGNPISRADLKSGEVVLDLGSGAGLDAFLAAGQVGVSGKGIGVDMTPDRIFCGSCQLPRRDNAPR